MFKTIVTHILRLHLVFQAESQRANDNNDDDDNDDDADADDAAAIERVYLHPHDEGLILCSMAIALQIFANDDDDDDDDDDDSDDDDDTKRQSRRSRRSYGQTAWA